MAGTNQKLVNKLYKRAKKIKEKERNFEHYDKVNKQERTLAKSPRAFSLSRKIERRLDRNWGLKSLGHKPLLSFSDKLEASAVARVVYVPNPSGFGIQLTLPTGIISAVGIQPNDIIEFRNGVLSGKELQVVAIIDATHVMLEDVATYTSESNIFLRAFLSSLKAQFNQQSGV
jgi:hypothetical protein